MKSKGPQLLCIHLRSSRYTFYEKIVLSLTKICQIVGLISVPPPKVAPGARGPLAPQLRHW